MDTATTSTQSEVAAQLGPVPVSNPEMPKTGFPLMRLPIEVRILIYRWAVGNRIIHVAERPNPFTMSLYRSGYGLYHYGCQSLKSETEIYNASKATTHQDVHPLLLVSSSPHGDCSLTHWLGVSNDLPDARLLAVSPECKLEGMKALWSTNTFSFAGYSPLQHWLRLMPQDKLAMIHHVRLEMWMRGSITNGANTLVWAQAIERIPSELPNLLSVNLVLYLDGYLTCWRNSQAGRLTDMFKALSRMRDLRDLTVVLNEDPRKLNSHHIAGAWCDQRCCDHFSLKAQDPEWRRQIGLVWAEEIRLAILHRGDHVVHKTETQVDKYLSLLLSLVS